jgi:endonuclease/exonuclease/phosphatase family metal-dependent hydrolase
VTRSILSVALAVSLLSGCDPDPAAAPTDATSDPADEAFVVGKADGGCVAHGSAAAIGMLELANDPEISEAELDAPSSEGGVGLDRRAAQGIAAARPFADLEALDAVPYVGQQACRALADYACNVDSRCHAELSVMSWNLRHFPYTDQTEDAAVEVIRQYHPDLVGLQEIEDLDAFDRLLERLPEYEGVLGEPGPFTRVAALVRTDRLQMTSVEHLFVDDWYAFPRPMLAVEATVVDAREPTTLTFGVVHLKASGGTANEARRRAGVEKLRGWFDGLRAAGRDDTIVVGDFNDELTDAEPDNVFGALLDPTANVQLLTLPIEDAGGISYVPWSRMLDHVVVTEEIDLQLVDTEILALDQTWRDDYLEVVSDHRPVRSRFEVTVGY